MTPVNDAPTITSNGAGASAAIDVSENQTAVTAVTSSDVDGGTPVYSISGGADAVLFSIDSVTGVLRFNTAPNFEIPTDAGGNNIYDVIVQVDDGSLSNNSDSQALAITVSNVNEAPTSANGSVTTPEDTAYVFSLTDFSFSDPDVADSLSVVRISSLPAVGSLQLNGVAVTLNQQISAADITAGNLRFVPVTNANGAAYASFGFALRDQAALESGVQSMTVNVSASNNAPIISTNVTPTINEAGNVLITNALLQTTDIDNTPAQLTYTVTALTSNGSLLLSGVALAANSTFTQADIDAGRLSYQHNGSETTTDGFNFNVTDGAGGSIGVTTYSINVTPVNDAPTITPVTLTPIVEDSGVRIITQGELLANAADVDTPLANLNATGLTITAGNGNLVDNGNGTWSYTPALNDDSAVSFSYSINDGTSSIINSASLDIIPGNNAPNIIDVMMSVDENAASATPIYNASDSFTASDFDRDGDAITYSIASGNALGGFAINANSGVITVANSAVLDFETTTAYSLTITASDGNLTDSAILNVNLINLNDNAPRTTPITLTPLAVGEGSRIITQNELLANAFDADGSALIVSNVSISEGNGNLLDNGNGTWRYTPAANDSASVSFTYTVSDGSFASTGSANVNLAQVLLIEVSRPDDPPPATQPPAIKPSPSSSDTATSESANVLPDLSIAPTSTNEDALNVAAEALRINEQRAIDVSTNFDNNYSRYLSQLFIPFTNSLLVVPQIIDLALLPALNISSIPNQFNALANIFAPDTQIEVASMQFFDPDDASVQNLGQFVLKHEVAITSVVLSVGLVTWALQFGALFTSLLATVPAWQNVDPIAILGKKDDDDAEWDNAEDANGNEESAGDVLSSESN